MPRSRTAGKLVAVRGSVARHVTYIFSTISISIPQKVDSSIDVEAQGMATRQEIVSALSAPERLTCGEAPDRSGAVPGGVGSMEENHSSSEPRLPWPVDV